MYSYSTYYIYITKWNACTKLKPFCMSCPFRIPCLWAEIMKRGPLLLQHLNWQNNCLNNCYTYKPDLKKKLNKLCLGGVGVEGPFTLPRGQNTHLPQFCTPPEYPRLPLSNTPHVTEDLPTEGGPGVTAWVDAAPSTVEQGSISLKADVLGTLALGAAASKDKLQGGWASVLGKCCGRLVLMW